MAELPLRALVLTSPPGASQIENGVLAAVRAELTGHTVLEETWLAEREAWQALLRTPAHADAHLLRTALVTRLAQHPIDVNIVPAEPSVRRKRLLVADMESTIIEQECLDELAGQVGLRDRISSITARAMRGEIDFEAALKERVALLRGLDVGLLHDVHRRLTLMPGASALVRTMQRHGATCVLVTGGFSFFAEPIAQRVGFDGHQANVLELAGSKLAGTVAAPILGREAKLAALQRLTQDLRLEPGETLAVGDGANDLAMIKAAGLGVAFRAKPLIAAAAQATIAHGDLTALLYLQGYRRDEFADDAVK